MTESELLLLTPSAGYGGGIERVADAIERAWRGPVRRVDLYRRQHVETPAGHPAAKAGFAYRTMVASAHARPQVVLANHVALLPVAFASARPWGASVRALGHGLEVWEPMSELRRRLVRRSRPFAVSSYTARHMAQRAGLQLGTVPVLSLPVGPAFAEVARVAPREREHGDRLILLTVSRITSNDRYKGHFEVAAAMPQILRARPDARWVVVGTGDDLEPLRRRCQQLGVESAVDLRGALDEDALLHAYREAHTFLLPSDADADATPPYGEGFGLVYAEAGCFELPSIASTHGGGALDFVEHGRTGLLADPRSSEALVNAVLTLARDTRLRDRLGRAARERVLTTHLPQHFAARLDGLLTE